MYLHLTPKGVLALDFALRYLHFRQMTPTIHWMTLVVLQGCVEKFTVMCVCVCGTSTELSRLTYKSGAHKLRTPDHPAY